MNSHMRNHSRARSRHRGAMLLYIMIVVPAAFAFCALGVDASHCMLVKNQLQNAADAAALAGALQMGNGMNSAISAATTTAAANKANGTSVVLVSANDIQFLSWTSKSNYTVLTAGNYASANAIRVTTRRSASAGTGVKTFFAGSIGMASSDITATAVATYSAGTNTTITVPGLADPWLAGMPSGTTANYVNQVHNGSGPWTDSAPTNSPPAATGTTLTAGNPVQFTFNGTVSNWAGANSYGCDGDPSYISNNWWAAENGDSEHGIANVTAPLACVIGVFLDANAPNTEGAAPPSLDFTSSASRDFASISPQLRQPFYIGNGVRADGTTPQNFVVPTGATRLFIGIMDFQQWADNSGTMQTTVNKPQVVKLVQ